MLNLRNRAEIVTIRGGIQRFLLIFNLADAGERDIVLPIYARYLARMFTRLGALRVLRQWDGMIHPTPDGGSRLGPHPDVDGLWFSAVGPMVLPAR
jgi:glycine/D-amino acid oxidase-like deaminating enzyme